jgi:2-hydroxy-6-oxonona-2,4-dienedioate hydrolase
LLLLHGTGGHAENFVRNIQAYAEHFSVHAIDLLWHGFSSTPPFNAEILPSMIEQIRDVAHAIGAARMHIEGQSMGGWIAANYALRFPDGVGKLVLTTPMGYKPDEGVLPNYKEADQKPLLQSNLKTLREPTTVNVRERMAKIMADRSRLTDEAVAVRRAIYRRPEINAAQQLLMQSYLAGPEVRRHFLTDKRLADLACPTLVYWADHNPVPPFVGEHMARVIPNCRFHCAADTGHWAQFENSSEHNRVVLDFLTSEGVNGRH